MAIALKSMRVQLDDPRLLRQQCYVGGSWIDADSKKTITVTDPATGETVGTVPSLGVEEVRACDRRGRGGAAGLAGQDGQGAGRRPAPLVRADHGRTGGPGRS